MLTPRAQQAAADFNRFAESMGMAARCDPSLTFENPKLGEAAQIWRAKSGDNGLPARRDLGARALKAFLPNVIIADIVEDHSRRRYRFRVMGTTIAELLGDHTGKLLDEAVISPFRERWFAVLDVANKAGWPVRISGRLEYRQQNHLSMEMMLAPLGTDKEKAEAVLAIAYASYSARHVFQPLVRNTISVPPHDAAGVV